MALYAGKSAALHLATESLTSNGRQGARQRITMTKSYHGPTLA